MIGFGTRVTYAFRCFFALLFRGEIPQDIVQQILGPATPAVAKPAAAPIQAAIAAKPLAESFDRAVQVLALLQRDGRLIDFLAEDVTPYPDAQLGAAVRAVHDSCKQVLDRYVQLEPILNSEEDQPVTLPGAIDPASVKLIGNVASQQPIRGMLRHRGWRVKQVSLPPLPEGDGRSVVAPAEVEIP